MATKIIDKCQWQKALQYSVLGLFLFLLLIAFGAYPFLTAERHMDADILVVEGWQSEEALEDAAELFLSGNYKMLVTTGGRKVSSHYLKQDHELKILLHFPEMIRSGSELRVNISGIDGASFLLSICDSVNINSTVTGSPHDFKIESPCNSNKIIIKSLNSRQIDKATDNLFIKYILLNNRDIHQMNMSVENWIWVEDEETGEIVGTGEMEATDHANNAKEKLIELGVSYEFTLAAPGDSIGSDRTKHNANGLRKKLETEGLLESNFTLFTTGIHARRSRILYEQALGKEIGVIVHPDPAFPPYSWWTDAGNWKRVMKELSGCFYYSTIGNSK